MTALYVILGIILFFIAILSIRITFNGEFFESFKLDISWLFLKFNLIPFKDKTDKKKNNEKR